MWAYTKKITHVCLLMYFLSNVTIASTITVEDIVSGIESRKSKVMDIELLYSVKKEYQDGYYQYREDKMKEFSKSFDENLRNFIIDLPPREEANEYHIFQKGDQLAFELFSSNKDGSKEVTQRAVYKDGVQKFLNIPEKNGVIEPIHRDQFMKFPTFPGLLGINNMDIVHMIDRPDVKTNILGEHIENGDLIADLEIVLEVFPDPDNKHGFGALSTRTTWAVSINTSKDFWPIKIERNTSSYEKGKETATYRGYECKSGNFIYSGGVYFPTEVDITKYYQGNPSQEPVISELHSARIEKVEINSGLSDDIFEMDFPDGTFYHDAISGLGMTVGDFTPFLGQRMQEEILNEPLESVVSEPVNPSLDSTPPQKTFPEKKKIANKPVNTLSSQPPFPLKQSTRFSYRRFFFVAMVSVLTGIALALMCFKKKAKK